MSFVVNPGHEEKLFFAMAAVKVDTGGDRQAACRYVASSCFDCFCLIITFALLIGKSKEVFVCFGFNLHCLFFCFFIGVGAMDLVLSTYIAE